MGSARPGVIRGSVRVCLSGLPLHGLFLRSVSGVDVVHTLICCLTLFGSLHILGPTLALVLFNFVFQTLYLLAGECSPVTSSGEVYPSEPDKA